MNTRDGKGRKTSRSSKREARPRLVAKTTPEIKDWLRRAAEHETEQLRSSVRSVTSGTGEQVIDLGQLKVTESHIIRRAVERELIKIQMAGGPGPTPTDD